MERSKLAVILRDLREFMGEHPLIVAGSQSAHGQIAWVPSIVVTSVEVDIFVLPGRGLHDPIEEQFGLDTPYHAAHGVYADPLGAGIVSLPPGWDERLVTLSADDGSVTWQALEIHDTAVSKLMAGRAKDWRFIIELLFAGALDMERFLQRALLMHDTVHAGALRPRLEKLTLKTEMSLNRRQQRQQRLRKLASIRIVAGTHPESERRCTRNSLTLCFLCSLLLIHVPF